MTDRSGGHNPPDGVAFGVLADGSYAIDPNASEIALESQLEEWEDAHPRLPLGDVVKHAARSAMWANYLLPLVDAAKSMGASLEQAIIGMNEPMGAMLREAYPDSERARGLDAELLLVVFELLWLVEVEAESG